MTELGMTLEERARYISDLAAPGLSARGSNRERRVYARALRMLREVAGVPKPAQEPEATNGC